MGIPRPSVLRFTLLSAALLTLAGAGALALARPSHQRAWRTEQAVLPEVRFEGDVVRIRNVRNFAYRTAEHFDPRYEDRTYDLARLQRVWFVLSPFGGAWRGPAHAFLSFEFADGQHVSISVEARREVGEEYSVVKGLLRRYELIYVIGDERDLVALRAVHWNDPTYLYPVRATPEQAREIFVRMLERAQQIERRPEFYNTISNNCLGNIVDEVNEFATRRIRYGWEVLAPGYSDDLAYEMGLIDSELSLAEVRERYRINARAQAASGDPAFSQRIRAPVPSRTD
jgi:hypothetical protein